MAQTLLDNPISPSTPPISPASIPHGHNNPNPGVVTIRLLISHNLMGTVIGRQGAKIKHIQDTSGVRMTASKTLLPQSTERVVEVRGSVEGIRLAMLEIGRCLIEDKDRAYGTILYNPSKASVLSNGNAFGSDHHSNNHHQSSPHHHGKICFNRNWTSFISLYLIFIFISIGVGNHSSHHHNNNNNRRSSYPRTGNGSADFGGPVNGKKKKKKRIK